jgi:hypothetical protein
MMGFMHINVAPCTSHDRKKTVVKYETGTYSWMSPEQVPKLASIFVVAYAFSSAFLIFTASLQALSAVSKNYTLCDMFSFGLIVKWLIVGDVADVPFAGMPTDQMIRVHSSLASSNGSMPHPYVSDLSRVPPVFHPLIQAIFPPFCPLNPLHYTSCVLCDASTAPPCVAVTCDI